MFLTSKDLCPPYFTGQVLAYGQTMHKQSPCDCKLSSFLGILIPGYWELCGRGKSTHFHSSPREEKVLSHGPATEGDSGGHIITFRRFLQALERNTVKGWHSKHYWVLRGLEHQLVSRMRSRAICHCLGPLVCEFPPHPVCLVFFDASYCFPSFLSIFHPSYVKMCVSPGTDVFRYRFNL